MSGCVKGYPPKEFQETEEPDCNEYWIRSKVAIHKEHIDKIYKYSNTQIQNIKKEFKDAVMIVVTEKGAKDRTCFKKLLYYDKGYCETIDSRKGHIKWGICSPACKWVNKNAKVI